MSLHFSEGNIDDIEEVFRLNRALFDEFWSKDVMLQSLQVGYDLYLCRDGQELIAYLLSQDILFETQVMQIGVKPEYRRRGIAKKLMQMLMEEKKDMDVVMLEVRASNTGSQAFYAQLGFTEVGVRPNYYSETATKPREDAVLMSLYPSAQA